jgi:hypothetical protein
MITKTAPSYPVSIFIAGFPCDAYRICREYCDKVGFCVTVSATEYIYTNGSESGVIVGLINYPRFPSTPGEILFRAVALADRLSRSPTGSARGWGRNPIRSKRRT